DTELLRLAAGVEQGSAHPLASAIVWAARERNITIPQVSQFVSTTGKGVSGVVEGRAVEIGAAESGGVLVTVGGQAAGVIRVADAIRETTAEAVRALKADGLRVVMLTGDNRATAEAVAAQLGIEDVRAQVLPADKQKVVEEFQRQGHAVAMA